MTTANTLTTVHEITLSKDNTFIIYKNVDDTSFTVEAWLGDNFDVCICEQEHYQSKETWERAINKGLADGYKTIRDTAVSFDLNGEDGIPF